MRNTLYAKRDVTKYYFTLPNEIFDLELHYIEIDIYAYLLRIEDRRTFQSLASYSEIAKKLGISINTVAKYVGKLKEHGLIRTEHTEIITQDGLKRNGCLRYHILPIRYAVDLHHKHQIAELERTVDAQKARKKAEKLGIEYAPPNTDQSA